MKNIIGLLLLLACMSCTKSYPGFVLKGNLAGAEGEKIYLNYTDSLGQQMMDSAVVTGKVFEFRGGIDEPTSAFLMSEDARAMPWESPNAVSLWLEPGEMHLKLEKGAFKKGVLTGSVTNDEAQELNRALQTVQEKMRKLSEAYRSEQDRDKAAAIKDQMEPYYEEMSEIAVRFIREHPDSYVSVQQMVFRVGSMTYKEARTAYDGLSGRVKKSARAKEVAEDIQKLKNGSPGSPAAMFAKPDIDGGMFDLNALKGKYVIVDFWASWCVPCRKSNPHLKELYKKYNDQGLEVVCVSDDDSDENKWRAAVEKDGIGMFHHVLRGLKRVGNDFDRSEDISELYGIHSLPTKILIDREGIIIGRYGGGGEPHEKMDGKLKEVFGN